MSAAGYAWVVMDEAGAHETPVAVADTREAAERYARQHRWQYWPAVAQWAGEWPASADDPRCMTGMSARRVRKVTE